MPGPPSKPSSYDNKNNCVLSSKISTQVTAECTTCDFPNVTFHLIVFLSFAKDILEVKLYFQKCYLKANVYVKLPHSIPWHQILLHTLHMLSTVPKYRALELLQMQWSSQFNNVSKITVIKRQISDSNLSQIGSINLYYYSCLCNVFHRIFCYSQSQMSTKNCSFL